MNLNDYKEIRQTGTAEVTAREICGYAILFNNWSNDLGGFFEMILPEAITKEFLKSQDIFCYFNHDDTKVLARSYKGEKGTLNLKIDDKGLFYSFPIKKNSPLHQEVRELINSGECLGSSFGFVTSDSNCIWEKHSDGKYRRTIKAFNYLFDLSPVFTPAYKESSCNTRFYVENVMPKDKEVFHDERQQLQIAKKNDEIKRLEELMKYQDEIQIQKAKEYGEYIKYLRMQYEK